MTKRYNSHCRGHQQIKSTQRESQENVSPEGFVLLIVAPPGQSEGGKVTVDNGLGRKWAPCGSRGVERGEMWHIFNQSW